MGFRCVGLLAVIALAACAHRNPYTARQEHQEAQARAYAPAKLARGDRAWRAHATARVRLYVDPSYADQDVRAHFMERLARANAVLEAALGTRLVLDEVRELPAEAAHADIDQALQALEQIDSGDDQAFVVGLLGGSPLATLSFHHLGRARMLGRHIVLRSMDDADELRAIGTLDELDAEERSRLYQERKRHKEAAVLLHEIGHCLGALHVQDRADLMHPHYDHKMVAFAPQNLELMRLALDERMRPEAQQDFEQLVRVLTEKLRSEGQSVFVASEREEHLASLTEALARSHAGGEGRSASRRAAASTPASTASTAKPDWTVRELATAPASNPSIAPTEDLSMLSEADRVRFAEIETLRAAGNRKAAYEALHDLATRYPRSYAVQHEACEVAMQIGVPYRQFRVYCDRLTTLATQSTASGP